MEADMWERVMEGDVTEGVVKRKPVIETLERTPAGIPGFDPLIEGGFERKSIVMLSGYAGTGKTTFALQFLHAGIKQYNENGVFLSFSEGKESIYIHAQRFGWNLQELEDSNKLRFLQYKAHQVSKLIEEGGGTVRDAISEINASRLVIDSITAYGLLFKEEYKERQALLTLFELLKKWGCTTLVVSESLAVEDDPRIGNLGFLTDGIVSFYYARNQAGTRMHRVEVLKMRGTRHSNRVADLLFERNGLRVETALTV
ncbi:MAG: AAA family ATPase [Candidatus Diapherotrites archaeon]|nr:AAA family ATPase [Candidatus Diapherotrites archaeon]